MVFIRLFIVSQMLESIVAVRDLRSGGARASTYAAEDWFILEVVASPTSSSSPWAPLASHAFWGHSDAQCCPPHMKHPALGGGRRAAPLFPLFPCPLLDLPPSSPLPFPLPFLPFLPA